MAVRRMAVAGWAVLALGSSAVPVAAQRDLLGPGAGFITIGTSAISTSELDDWLDERGYPTFGSRATTVGIGGYRLLSNGWLLGFEGTGLIVGDEMHDGRQVGVGGGYATLAAGYMVELGKRARIYPRLGIGAGGMALWTQREDTAAFEDVLNEQVPNSDQEISLGRDGLVFDLGFGAEFLPRGRGGPVLGVRAGYLTGPSPSEWESPDHTVTGGPDASVAGPYIRVAIGWAWRR